MAIAHHTHHFELPVASLAEVVAGSATDKVVVPASLGSAAAQDISTFASAAQGIKADLAVQPQDLGELAVKDRITVEDIEAQGQPDATRFLRGDGLWATPTASGGDGGGNGDNEGGGNGGSGGAHLPCYENWIINGGFTIDQRRNQGSSTLGVWSYDRWLNVVGGRQQMVEAVSPGDYALFWEGGGTAQLGDMVGISPLIANLDGGNVKIVVPMNGQNIALVRWQGEVPKINPYQARPFTQELQLCQRYYQKSVNYALAPEAGHDVYKLTLAVTGGLGKNQMQACLRLDVPMARPPMMAYYGNAEDASSVVGLNSLQQSSQIAVETLYACENYCIFANAHQLSTNLVSYKLNFAADAEMTM